VAHQPRLPVRSIAAVQAGYGDASAYIVRESVETNALCEDKATGGTIGFPSIGIGVTSRQKDVCWRRSRWRFAALLVLSMAIGVILVLILKVDGASSRPPDKEKLVKAPPDSTLQADSTGDMAPPPTCCMALIASCIACSRDVTIGQLCAQEPSISGCQHHSSSPLPPLLPEQRQVAMVALSIDISQFNADRQAFASDFTAAMGAILSVNPTRIVIVDVQPGSVHVQFYVRAPATAATGAVELSAAAAMALLSNSTHIQRQAQTFSRFNLGTLTPISVATRSAASLANALYLAPGSFVSQPLPPSPPATSVPCERLNVPYCGNHGMCIRHDDPPFYHENGAIGIGWSHSKVSVAGSTGLVHGPWGREVKKVSTVVSVPSGVQLCRVSWRSWAIDSRDGEIDRVAINGVRVWESRPRQHCLHGWTNGPADFPNPWRGQRARDVCYVNVTVDVACTTGSMLIEFSSGINQGINDEAWAFSSLAVDTTPSYNTVLAELGAESTGWSNTEITHVGSAGLVHGPWGKNTRSVTKIVALPTGVSGTCRLSWRSWAIDSRDGELDSVFVDQIRVWQRAPRRPCQNGWQYGPGDFPNPWRGQRSSHVCYVDVTVQVPCSGTMHLEFRSAINQAEHDEAWAFSSVTVSTLAPYRCFCHSGWAGDTCDTIASGAGVVIGRSSAAGAEGSSACANVAAKHEVRCCADTPLRGYQRHRGCGVWAESSFRSAGGCVHEATLARATQICAMDGARLCTVAELEADCTAGSGCGHDADLVWSSGQCVIPSGPALPEAPTHAWTVLGNFRSGGHRIERQRCAASTVDLHEVRCCSNHQLPGYRTSPSCTVWGASHVGPTGGCVEHVTLVTALAICHGDGARVCSVEELQGGCGQGTGCGHDFDLVLIIAFIFYRHDRKQM
jgi:hypothetical protein